MLLINAGNNEKIIITIKESKKCSRPVSPENKMQRKVL